MDKPFLAAAALMLLLAVPARGANVRLPAGARIAQTYCAGCHATGRSGSSPLAEAPPFRELSQRGDLLDLLSEGMIAGPGLQEEGERRRHPRMPSAPLDEAQLGDLVAYLRSIQAPGPPI